MSEIFFTADQHYGHSRIIEFQERPFADLDEMHEALIRNYNDLVQDGDTVYFLGDFSFQRKPDEVFYRLKGQKNLILGNHDREKLVKHLPWGWIKSTYKLKVKDKENTDQRIWLSHYAHRVWPHSHHGSIHLYGHSHGNLEDWGKSTDVGVDAWNYKPVHLDQILDYMKNKPATAHHGRIGGRMIVRVLHAYYGCDTGCCGHMVEVDGETVSGSFDFGHYSKDDEEALREYVLQHVPKECHDSIDWDTLKIEECWEGW